ncbi:unnamed protein product, partial [Porites lobata]
KEAKYYKVIDSKIKYKRIPIEVKYQNEKKDRLIIETPLLFSFGVNEKKNQETKMLVGKDSVNPFQYLDQYCHVHMALIIEGIFISKTVVSLQIKVHKCYVKQLKPRQSLRKINESDNESNDESDTETVEQSEVDNIEDLIISDKVDE